MLVGYLDNPLITCPKLLMNQASNTKIISLAVKTNVAGPQKFTIPLTNESQSQVANRDFKFPQTNDASSFDDGAYENG